MLLEVEITTAGWTSRDDAKRDSDLKHGGS